MEIQKDKSYVVGLGEVLWDVLPEGKQLGGAPANFAYHVTGLGLPGMVVSAIGSDELGDEIIASFEKKHMEVLLERVPYPTGTVQVCVDVQGIPCYEIKEQVAWDYIPFTTKLEKLARSTSAVCFGSLAQRSETSRQTILAFLRAMPDRQGVYKIFDINLRQHFYTEATLLASLAQCNVLKINDEELSGLQSILGRAGSSMPDFCRHLLSEFQLEVLIVTCGVQGSYVFTPDYTSFLPTPQVKVADTVGAGDSFTATFITTLLRGFSISEAHELAVQVSAYVCSQHGAMPKLPDTFVNKCCR